MEIEKAPLALGESANVEDALRLDAHAQERGPVLQSLQCEVVRYPSKR
jgi:hypothetical protein